MHLPLRLPLDRVLLDLRLRGLEHRALDHLGALVAEDLFQELLLCFAEVDQNLDVSVVKILDAPAVLLDHVEVRQRGQIVDVLHRFLRLLAWHIVLFRPLRRVVTLVCVLGVASKFLSRLTLA